jgi:glycosyltransferase involved in cell wall biosynthesis
MPTLYPEPFGLVAVEALGAGVPVAIASSALLAEEIEDAGAGWSFNPGDPAEFAGTLTKIVNCSRDDMQRRSRAALSAAPNLSQSTDDWLDGLESIYASLPVGRA